MSNRPLRSTQSTPVKVKSTTTVKIEHTPEVKVEPLPDIIVSTPDTVLSNLNEFPAAPVNPSVSSSYTEPEWCWEADCINETIYGSIGVAQDAIAHLLVLLANDDIHDTKIRTIRGSIILYFHFEALPSDYRGTVKARYEEPAPSSFLSS